MADGRQEKPESSTSVGEVVRQFLADVEGRVKPNTLRVYRYFLMPFTVKHGTLSADALTPTLAESYSRKPEWSPSSRSEFLGSLVSAMRWAVRSRLIAQNPLAGIQRPVKASRGSKAIIGASDHQRLLDVASPTFRQYLIVLHATGARPGEVAAITAENFDADAGAVRLDHHKTAHKGHTRTIYLPPGVAALLRQQAGRHPSGPLLRTKSSRAWTPRPW
jgi:integrase